VRILLVIRWVVAVVALSGCAAPAPAATPDQILELENRGGPELSVHINGNQILDMQCGDDEVLRPGASDIPSLPWDLVIVRVRDGKVLVSTQVTALPRWFTQLGDFEGQSNGLSESPIAGPPIPCPPSSPASSLLPTTPPTLTPRATDPYAGLPSNACGGFHLKIVNDRAADVSVSLNNTFSRVIRARSAETIVEGFDVPEQLLGVPWHVVVTDKATGEQLFESTVTGPVDQKVTLSADGATQAPYDLSEDDCGHRQ